MHYCSETETNNAHAVICSDTFIFVGLNASASCDILSWINAQSRAARRPCSQGVCLTRPFYLFCTWWNLCDLGRRITWHGTVRLIPVTFCRENSSRFIELEGGMSLYLFHPLAKMICVDDLLSSAASACVFASHQLCEGLLRMLSCANVALSLST